jgi:hypothetical protein
MLPGDIVQSPDSGQKFVWSAHSQSPPSMYQLSSSEGSDVAESLHHLYQAYYQYLSDISHALDQGHRCPLPAPRFPPRVSDNRQATRRQHRCYDDPDRSQQNDAFKAPLLGRTIFQLLCVRRTIVPRSVASASCEDAFLIRSTICRYGRNLAPFIRKLASPPLSFSKACIAIGA